MIAMCYVQVEAARYLMQRFSAARQDCVFLCDDDNDLALAADVGKAFLPSITSVSETQYMAIRAHLNISGQACTYNLCSS